MNGSRFTLVLLSALVIASPAAAKGVQDPFGTKVKSFRTLPIGGLNAGIQKARAEHADWAGDAVMIAMHVVPGVIDSSGERRALRVGFEGDGNESPSSGIVTIREDVLMDDSVAAVWHQLLMSRDSKGNWSVTEHRSAQRCQRGVGDRREFRAELCP